MGVYSQYNTMSGNTVAANEAYEGAVGAYQMIEESEINSYNIFESVIGRDFAETLNSFDESAITESDMMAINEASAEGIWGKVVAFVQKIWEKIKGILNSIKTKIQSVFIRDGKELYNKYKKTINDKINNGKLSSFKFKWKEFQENKSIGTAFGTNTKDLLNESDIINEMKWNLTHAKTLKDSHSANQKTTRVIRDRNPNSSDDADSLTAKGGVVDYSNKGEDIAKVNDTSEDKGLRNIRPYTTDETTDMLEKALGELCGQTSTTVKEFPKEFHDSIFKEEEEEDNISKRLTDIESALQNGKKILDGITKAEKETDRSFKTYKTDAENIKKAMQKANSDKSTQSTFAAAANRTAGRTTTCLNLISKASGMLFSAATSCTKEYLKQCRSVYIKAAAYNQKKAPYEESATLLEAMADVSDYEVEEMFATI